MSRTRCLCTPFLACGILVCAGGLSAAGKKSTPKVDPSPAAVEKVLRAEVAGPIDRRERLLGELAGQSDSASAHWQAGFVRDGRTWQEFDHPRSAANSDVMEQYFARRGSAQPTVGAQSELADWCLKHNLRDQARAHLTAALAVASPLEQPIIFPQLGYCKIGDRWISGEQLRAWQELNRRSGEAVKQWGPKLEKIAEKLEGSQRSRNFSMAILREPSDADVIPAIEYVLCGRSEVAAIAAVDAMARVDCFETTVALSKQAVFSKWPEVRKQAAESLKSRRLEDYLPALASLLATPETARVSTELWYWQDQPLRPAQHANCQLVLLSAFIIARETDSQFDVAVIKTVDYRLTNFLQNETVSIDRGLRVVRPGTARRNFVANLDLSRSVTDLGRDAADRSREHQSLADALNDRTDALNRQVISVLAGVTGRAPSPDPAVWWKWSDEFTDTQQIGSKPVVTVSEDTEIRGDPSTTIRRASCFAAGTPVWTDRGLQAIERIAVGDRVLTKDVETGELDYKPVLQTTVRPPKELTTLRFGDETIVCTGGHRFWASGQGWVKARDLTEQTLLHTVTGNTPVWTAKKGVTAETYNLVVADFHTYFVGKTGLLCQDLLPPQRTNNVVPGLARANAVAKVNQ